MGHARHSVGHARRFIDFRATGPLSVIGEEPGRRYSALTGLNCIINIHHLQTLCPGILLAPRPAGQGLSSPTALAHSSVLFTGSLTYVDPTVQVGLHSCFRIHHVTTGPSQPSRDGHRGDREGWRCNSYRLRIPGPTRSGIPRCSRSNGVQNGRPGKWTTNNHSDLLTDAASRGGKHATEAVCMLGCSSGAVRRQESSGA